MPTVSVIMSVYNGEDYIKRSIDSILNQTFQDFEFIIIDDGSTDGSTIILEAYEALYSCVKLVKHNNIGLTKSLIIGCNLAKGKYVARQDVDDYSESDRLKLQVNKLENNQDLVLIGTWYEVVGLNNLCTLQKPPDNDAYIRRSMFYNNPFCHSSVMFRKSAYSETTGYDVSFRTTQGLDLWFRMSMIGKLRMVEQCLVKRMIHPACISSGRQAWNQIKNSFNIRKKYYSIVEPHPSIYVIYISEIYHISMTLLPDILSRKLSNIVGLIKNRFRLFHV